MKFMIYEKFKSNEKIIVELDRVLPISIDILHIRFIENECMIEICCNEPFELIEGFLYKK